MNFQQRSTLITVSSLSSSLSFLRRLLLVVTAIVLLPPSYQECHEVLAFQSTTIKTTTTHAPNPKRLTSQASVGDVLSVRTTTASALSLPSTNGNSESKSNGAGTRTPTFDDESLQFAYNEWKLMYGKQDEPFNKKRFESFKSNYQALTMANLEAREQAMRNGRPVPQWMTLNEYGDYTIEEYFQKQQQKKKASTPTPSSSSSYGAAQAIQSDMTYSTPSTSYSGTQVISSTASPSTGSYIGAGTQVISSSSSSSSFPSTGPYRGAGTQVIRSSSPAPAMSYSSSTNMYGYGSGGSESEFQDQFGRTIPIVQDSPSSSTSFGTQVIRSSSSSSSSSNNKNSLGGMDGTAASPTGTRVIKRSDGGSSSSSSYSNQGTQVIRRSSGAETDPSYSNSSNNSYDIMGGTRVIQPVDTLSMDGRNGYAAGTKVIKKASSPLSSPTGTQTIQPVDSLGMSSSWPSSSSSSSGTQIIKADKKSSNDNDKYNYSGNSDIGTKVLQTSSKEKKKRRGTIVVSKDDDKEVWSKFIESLPLGRSSSSSSSEEDDDEGISGRGRIGKRKTMSIKKSIPDPKERPSLLNFMRGKANKGDTLDGKRGTIVIKGPEKAEGKSLFDSIFGGSSTPSSTSKKQSSNPKATTEVAESSSPISSSIFSLFSGKKESDESRSVRGTITIPRNGKQSPSTSSSIDAAAKKKTVLLDKKATNNAGRPSVLSFFGGTKKGTETDPVRNANARATLMINKPSKTDELRSKKNGITAAQLARQKEEAAAALKKKAEVAAEREARRKEREERRKEATRKRVERAKALREELTAGGITKDILFNSEKRNGKGTVAVTRNTQKARSLFGSFQTIPEMEQWKQNRDGSLTGYIYKSKSFEDGTRITTSAVPKGAKRGTTVTTVGGTKYFLR